MSAVARLAIEVTASDSMPGLVAYRSKPVQAINRLGLQPGKRAGARLIPRLVPCILRLFQMSKQVVPQYICIIVLLVFCRIQQSHALLPHPV